MLTNWEVSLKGKSVLLVPYRREHVRTYHGWMQDPWIRETLVEDYDRVLAHHASIRGAPDHKEDISDNHLLSFRPLAPRTRSKMTASEPLSLEEEYAMQISWKEDPKKCTFIVLALENEAAEAKENGSEGSGQQATATAAAVAAASTETSVMAGDVNLFFNDYEDPGMCEVEVMIAEERCRRRGLAKEAVLMLMRYAVDHLGATTFYCKIGDANAASRALFEQLGYFRYAYVEAFKETELRFDVAGSEGTPAAPALVALRTRTDHVQTMPCPAPAEVAETAMTEDR